MWVNGKMNIMHKALNHANSVRALSFRVKGFLHNNGCNVPKLTGQQRLPLLTSRSKLSFLQNLNGQPSLKYDPTKFYNKTIISRLD